MWPGAWATFRRVRDLSEKEKSTHHGIPVHHTTNKGEGYQYTNGGLLSNATASSTTRTPDTPDGQPRAFAATTCCCATPRRRVRGHGPLGSVFCVLFTTRRRRRQKRQQQPPSKGSLRGSKCTPLCNSQLPACKPIVCRGSQVSKSYIDAEQRHQRSSILDTCCMVPRAGALSACMQ